MKIKIASKGMMNKIGIGKEEKGELGSLAITINNKATASIRKPRNKAIAILRYPELAWLYCFCG